MLRRADITADCCIPAACANVAALADHRAATAADLIHTSSFQAEGTTHNSIRRFLILSTDHARVEQL